DRQLEDSRDRGGAGAAPREQRARLPGRSGRGDRDRPRDPRPHPARASKPGADPGHHRLARPGWRARCSPVGQSRALRRQEGLVSAYEQPNGAAFVDGPVIHHFEEFGLRAYRPDGRYLRLLPLDSCKAMPLDACYLATEGGGALGTSGYLALEAYDA